MPNSKWSQAAEKYQAAKITASTKEAAIASAVAELEEFMLADGETAMKLLGASGKSIELAEQSETSSFVVVYFFDGNGLQSVAGSVGLGAAYASFGGKTEQPKPSPITAEDAIRAAVEYGGKKPEEVVPWLRSELDRIASEAPRAK